MCCLLPHPARPRLVWKGFLPLSHNLPSFQALAQIKWKEKKSWAVRKNMAPSPTAPAEGTLFHSGGSGEASPEAGWEGGRISFEVSGQLPLSRTKERQCRTP